MFGNSWRQILCLHSVSVTTVSSLDAGVILCLPSFIRTPALPHVSVFDVWRSTPPLSPWRGSLSSRRLYSNLSTSTQLNPPTFISCTGFWQKPPESQKIPVKETLCLCATCYQELQYRRAGPVPVQWAFVLTRDSSWLLHCIYSVALQCYKLELILNYYNACIMQESGPVDGNRILNSLLRLNLFMSHAVFVFYSF